ncbi:ribonuclease III [Auricularia subglabra TFB-10046 SS5]|nr:ribonuclease III [Auricularia subglabra TFB-10046 SS5]
MSSPPPSSPPSGRPLYIDPTLPDEIPPLPEIKSDALRTQVFTHRSYYARPTHLFEDRQDDLSPDNERLEHLGDSVVGILVTELILELYPGIRVGPATKIRSLVVGNPTLAAISARYSLPDRLRVHSAQAITLRSSPHIQADTFEAYCGGLFLEIGLDGMREWFRTLTQPWVEQGYRIMKVEHGVQDDPIDPKAISEPPNKDSKHRLPPSVVQAVGHLSLFNQTLAQRGKFVEWVFQDTGMQSRTPMWYVEALVDSRCVGKGRGGTKKVAKNEAARHALIYLGVYEPQPEGETVLDAVLDRITRNDRNASRS